MSQELKRPVEGFDTLSADFAGRGVRKIVAALRALRERGMGERQIQKVLREQMRQFDLRSIHRIYLRSLGTPTPDDFRPEETLSVERPKAGTVVVETVKPLPAVEPEGLVQFEGKDYHVARIDGSRYTLKEIE